MLTRRIVAVACLSMMAALPAVITAAGGGAQATAPVDEAATPSAIEVPSGFQDQLAIGGISEPTAVAFAPDGTAFVALKSGTIKVWDYAGGQFEGNDTHNDFAYLDQPVMNYWDRGLTGITLDPDFPAEPYVYVNYTYNRDPGDPDPTHVPKWHDPSHPSPQYDDCVSPAAPPNTRGCVVMGRVSRLEAEPGPNGWTMVPGSELELLAGACFQFGSHASGDVRFGPDGFLYASFGDGASFDFDDYGQVTSSTGQQACPGDVTNEGGALRSQDLRTAGDPLDLGGAIFRINPENGRAPDGSTSNASRMVTYGQRNPWRLTFRPGTSELWSADVGGSGWEEINRTDVSGLTAPVNLGWPCYEGTPSGTQRNDGWDDLDLPICEDLYEAGLGAVQAPYAGYLTRGPKLVSTEDCQVGTSSVSGVAFAPMGNSYPEEYQGSVFFSDYARSCVWRLGQKPNGDPDPTSIIPFVQAAESPVELAFGPGGDLYYVDYGVDSTGTPLPDEGGVHRITYGNPVPVAAISADRVSGPLNLTVNFSASGSSDPQGGVLTYAWDLDGDGAFDDGAGVSASRTYTAAQNVRVSVRATSSVSGESGRASLTVYPGDDPPVIHSMSPGASFTWTVGEQVGFDVDATDPQQVLTDADFTWSLSIAHCPSVCHTHPLRQWPGQRSGTFQAPDHEYPSHLVLTVFVTDSRGMTVRETHELHPRTVGLRFATKPVNLLLTVAGDRDKAPFTRTFIVGSRSTISAPATQEVRGVTYAFRRWSDGGARSHELTAPGTAQTWTAKYRAVRTTLRLRTKPGGVHLIVNGKRRPVDWDGSFAPGDRVTVKAPGIVRRHGARWRFVRWSDGGAQRHRIELPPRRVTLKAIYRRIG